MKFSMKDFIALDLKGLLAVNGGGSCSSSSGGGGCSSTSSGGSGSSTTSSYVNGTLPGSNAQCWQDRSWSANGARGTVATSGRCSSTTAATPITTTRVGTAIGTTKTAGGNCGGYGEWSDPNNDGKGPKDFGVEIADEDRTTRLAEEAAKEADLAKVVAGIAPPIGVNNDDGLNITSPFGPRTPIKTDKGTTSDFHGGIDIAAPLGTRINTVADGVVTFVGNNDVFGNHVVVTHQDGKSTLYGHCDTVTIQQGTTVRAGEQIATVGSTGMSTGNHLHFGFDANGNGSYKDSCDDPTVILTYCPN